MPHLIAADVAATDNPGLRGMACNACYYLLARGDTRTGHDLASELRQHWRDRLGDDHQDTLAVTRCLAVAFREMGRYAEARDLGQDLLDRYRRVLGEDHPATLVVTLQLADNLRALGEVRAAWDLDQDTLDRYRRVLGEDHLSTLIVTEQPRRGPARAGGGGGCPGPGPGHPRPSAPDAGLRPPLHPGLR